MSVRRLTLALRSVAGVPWLAVVGQQHVGDDGACVKTHRAIESKPVRTSDKETPASRCALVLMRHCSVHVYIMRIG
jgi:hypothetical protein